MVIKLLLVEKESLPNVDGSLNVVGTPAVLSVPVSWVLTSISAMSLCAHEEVASSLELSASLDDSSNVVDGRSAVSVILSSVLTSGTAVDWSAVREVIVLFRKISSQTLMVP